MVVAVIAVWVVEVVLDEVVGVVSVRHFGVPAVGTVTVVIGVAATVVAGRACLGVRSVDSDPVFVGVPVVGMVEVPVMEVVHVSLMHYGRVPAARAMAVVVLLVRLMLTHVASSRRVSPAYLHRCAYV